MKKDYTHEFYVTRKCTKMEYFTVRANSMEEAKEEVEIGWDYYNFDFEELAPSEAEPPLVPPTPAKDP